jgi:hypothetical protein
VTEPLAAGVGFMGARTKRRARVRAFTEVLP